MMLYAFVRSLPIPLCVWPLSRSAMRVGRHHVSRDTRTTQSAGTPSSSTARWDDPNCLSKKIVCIVRGWVPHTWRNSSVAWKRAASCEAHRAAHTQEGERAIGTRIFW